ncbi:MAG: LemA family protein [Planctomycetes bacterium]|nr:LemA family protein [Planctomycetota bacterium]
MEPSLIAALAAGLLLLVWLIANYNRFVRLRNHITESWSNIDVEMKRRYELIPNLVAIVKGFAQHEKAVLEKVVELRNRAAASRGSAAAQAVDESALMLGLKQLFVVVENYPKLKSDAHFLALQKELALTEDRIAAARRFYNGNARDMRQLCEMFPTSLLAGLFRFSAPTFFELDSAAERVVPRAGLD